MCRSIAKCVWIGREVGEFDLAVLMLAVPILPSLNQMTIFAKLTSSKHAQRYKDLTNATLELRQEKDLKMSTWPT